ncbi:MAG: dUTP diphosphatase [Gammaproteobacteria bacterium]|jgi:dUTP pyrophosphatase|nr:dUTP diphosphatase [Gammaproteobacteria bacterium]|tara:strand:+ start:415 stop:867 length:453 start_codon:yes stop_codon:yes gene_type:complete
MKLKFKILDQRIGTDFDTPKYQTSGSAGLDLLACIEEELVLQPNESTIIPSGISIFIEDPEFAAIVIPRSGLGAKKGLVCGNLLGLIDSDYQGPLSISLWNRSQDPIMINAGERVAQLVVIRVNQVDLELVSEFTETARGAKGFGSTGTT